MNLWDRLVVLCLTLLDKVLDFFTFGAWSEVQGGERPGLRVKK